MKLNWVKGWFCSIIMLIFIFSAQEIFSSESKYCMLIGRLTDSQTQEGLAFASLQLSSLSDSSFTKGVMSDIKGNFAIPDIPSGNYILKASYMGYESKELRIDLIDRKTKVQIELQKKSFTLNEIEVTSEKQLSEKGIKKTTVNVSKDNTLTGGNAVDVMQSIASVDFDLDGQLQYRGSDRVTVLLNGNKSDLIKSLDQIPASQIEKIEIINNPSAKYEADGMSGIINIVLKTGNTTKNQGNFMIYSGWPETFGGSGGLSGFSDKISFFANASYNHKTRFQTKEHIRKNFEDISLPDYYQYDRQDEILNSVLINSGMDYQISNKHNLALSLIGSKSFNTANRSIQYKTLGVNDDVLFESLKEIDITLNNYSFDGDLNYNYKIGKAGQKLSASIHYSLFNQNQEMDNTYFPEYSEEHKQLQNTDSKQLNKIAQASVDYYYPLHDTALMEMGYRFNSKDLLNDFSSISKESNSDIWINDTSLNNKFHYLQYLHALYFSYQANMGWFDLQAGLRTEYTQNDILEYQKDDYFALFPSVLLSKQWSKSVGVFISANRRINRPTIKMLNPYTNEYADILNQHVGNPKLKPEYVNSFETGIRSVYSKISVSASVYYRNIDQAISRVKSATNDSALLVTFMNLDNAKLLGSEISLSLKPVKWWNISLSTNIFHTSLTGEYGPNSINRSHNAYNINMQNKIKLPLGIGLQISGYYRSKLPDVMGTYMERYYIDMALNKSVFNKKGKIVFKISDVFNTYNYGLDLIGKDENGYAYSQRNRRKNESQYFILSLSFNIESKEKQKKKENYFLEGFGK